MLTQAERYARGLNGPHATNGFGAPFLCATKGEVIWFRDARHDLNRSRKLAKFHAPAGLTELLERDLGGAGLGKFGVRASGFVSCWSGAFAQVILPRGHLDVMREDPLTFREGD